MLNDSWIKQKSNSCPSSYFEILCAKSHNRRRTEGLAAQRNYHINQPLLHCNVDWATKQLTPKKQNPHYSWLPRGHGKINTGCVCLQLVTLDVSKKWRHQIRKKHMLVNPCKLISHINARSCLKWLSMVSAGKKKMYRQLGLNWAKFG